MNPVYSHPLSTRLDPDVDMLYSTSVGLEAISLKLFEEHSVLPVDNIFQEM